MTDDADHVLLVLDRGDRGEIRLSRSRYQGRAFTKAQLWFRGSDGAMHPGRQVVTFRDHELRDVVTALGKIIAKVGSDHDPRTRRGSSRMVANAPPPLSEAELEADRRLF